MYPQSFSKSLNYKFRELELIIKQLDVDNEPSSIDVELALHKTRELYEILRQINSGFTEDEKYEGTGAPSGHPVIASDPDPVEGDEISEAEGITTSPMYSKTEKPLAGKETQKDLPDQKRNQAGKIQEKEKEKQKEKDEKPLPDPVKSSRQENDDQDNKSGRITGNKKDDNLPEQQKDPQSHDILIVADRYQSSQNFINQAIANKQTKTDLTTKLQSKPISDLRNSIGMNEKFLFIKELFKGRPEKYNQCIDDLNHSASYEEAISYIKNNYSWEEANEVVKKFLALVKRKHQAE